MHLEFKCTPDNINITINDINVNILILTRFLNKDKVKKGEYIS